MIELNEWTNEQQTKAEQNFIRLPVLMVWSISHLILFINKLKLLKGFREKEIYKKSQQQYKDNSKCKYIQHQRRWLIARVSSVSLKC